MALFVFQRLDYHALVYSFQAIHVLAHEGDLQPVSYTHLDVYKRQCHIS